MGRDRDRPSWRELDRRRDGSQRREKPPERPIVATVTQKRYRAALDQAFEKGEVGKLIEPSGDGKPSEPTPGELVNPRRSTAGAIAPSDSALGREELQSQKKLLARAKAAVGKQEMERAVDAYVRRFGWPQDLEFCSISLEHRRTETVGDALGQLERLIARERPRRAGLLGARLRLLEELAGEAEIRDRASALRRKL